MTGCGCFLCTRYKPRTLGVLWADPDGKPAQEARETLADLVARLRAEREASGRTPPRSAVPPAGSLNN